MPTLAPTTCFLEKNLAALGERNADLVEALRSVPTAPDVTFEETADGKVTGTAGAIRLASAHRPGEEAVRLASRVNIVEHAVTVVLGFGLGYHVEELARRYDRAGLLIVFEPDLGLLRAVLERIDHSAWLRSAVIVWLSDGEDRAALARKLQGAEGVVAQGLTFLEHPAARERLGDRSVACTRLVRDFVANAKTTLFTTLIRSADTIRNLLLNVDHYSLGPGVHNLAGAAAGYPAVVVAAGPSLRRNMHLLATPGVRDRCIIIAVQTTLKPLLAAGIRPHFVTALDYHEISRRFYEGLTASDVAGVTLIADPKAHPVILDSFPGVIRCPAAGFLDRLLGPLKREMGSLPAGATVAHLAFYVARHLGCDPVAFIGQDLGFTDGLYYARGTAIDEIWAPELNPFNTMEMMEWQRIARHRLHLHRMTDVEGKSILTDAQMLNYLQQFERDFADVERQGGAVIDATEGGVLKRHTRPMPLRSFLAEFATRTMPPLPAPHCGEVSARREEVARRLELIGDEVVAIEQTSRETEQLLGEMLESQTRPAAMSRLFDRLAVLRGRIERVMETFELLNHVNQLGVFKRQRADRVLQLAAGLTPLERQRSQLVRDRENVRWTADAAAEMLCMLDGALELMGRSMAETGRTDRPSACRPGPAPASLDGPAEDGQPRVTSGQPRIAAIIPVDPVQDGLGVRRRLANRIGGRTLLQWTLGRLSTSRRLDGIVLLAPDDCDLRSLLGDAPVFSSVLIERCGVSPFGPEQRAIAAARWWASDCWRGGIAGMSVFDEALCPLPMATAMEKHGFTGAIPVAPDWPLLSVTGEGGLDAMIDRHAAHPDQHNLVFTQAPPGLGTCLVSLSLMRELCVRNRLSTTGGLLVHQPHAPQGDPIARDANVQIDHRVRGSMLRAAADSAVVRQLLECEHESPDDPEAIVTRIEQMAAARRPRLRHLIVETNTDRTSSGRFAASFRPQSSRPRASLPHCDRLFAQAASMGDVLLTLHGAGDPLRHPEFDAIIKLARDRGILGVHIRTELACDDATVDRLLACPVDVVTVDLHADRAATYRAMMGHDGFRAVLQNIERLVGGRAPLTAPTGSAAIALPWIVPRLRRCRETYEDIEPFFERWQAALGCAVIEGDPVPWRQANQESVEGALASAAPPARVVRRELLSRMTIYADGSVPVSELDFNGRCSIGSVEDMPLPELWDRLVAARRRVLDNSEETELPLGIAIP